MSDTTHLKMESAVWIEGETTIRIHQHRTGDANNGLRVLKFGEPPYGVTLFMGCDDGLLWRLKKEIEAHFAGATKPEEVRDAPVPRT